MDKGNVDEATGVILAADLTPIEHRILIDFIKEANEPGLAAQEVLDSIVCNDNQPIEKILRSLKNNWHKLVAMLSTSTPIGASLRELVSRRDQYRCCVTPSDRRVLETPEPTSVIPPALADLGDVNGDELPLKSLLDAFMTPLGSSRLQSMLSDTSDQGRLANTWLLTPSILHAFRNGHLQIRLRGARAWKDFNENEIQDESRAEYFIMPIYPEMYEDIFLADRSSFHDYRFHGTLILETDDPKQLPILSPFLIKTHCKFANALHHFYVEERIAEGWGPLQSRSFISRNLQLMTRSIWLLLPQFIRIFCYRRLLNKGKSQYGQDISPVVQQLPFGLFAKRCDRTKNNETTALMLVENEAPLIPAPLLIDTFHDDGVNWFIMTRLPGVRAHDVLHRMSYTERNQLAEDLSQVLKRMHKIQNKTPYLFANVAGGPIYDRRIGYGGSGPYNSEADLNIRLAGGIQEYLKKQIPTAFSRSHKSVFTHGDLFFSNVLIDGGMLSGVVDWEDAAFMPEYWDFTKAMRAARNDDAREIYRRIWANKFDAELETEKWLWNAFPFGG